MKQPNKKYMKDNNKILANNSSKKKIIGLTASIKLIAGRVLCVVNAQT